MSGIRLHHPTLHSITLALEMPRLYPVPYLCPTCKATHLRKVFHLNIDHEGYVIVAPQIWDTMRREGRTANFDPVNEVRKPPPIALGNGAFMNIRIVDHKLGEPLDRSGLR